MAGRRDLFHTGEDRLTNGALRTGRMTSLGAGSGLFRNFNRSMSSCIDCFGLGCIANCAGVGLLAVARKGGGRCDGAFVPNVLRFVELLAATAHGAIVPVIRCVARPGGCRVIVRRSFVSAHVAGRVRVVVIRMRRFVRNVRMTVLRALMPMLACVVRPGC